MTSAIKSPFFPKTPDFVERDKEKWDKIILYFRTQFQGAVPFGCCYLFTRTLFVLLSIIYKGKLDGKKIKVLIGEKAAHLFPFQKIFNKRNHYALEIQFSDQTYVVDPTWKQFAYAKTNKEGVEEYNNRLSSFPDILVATREDFIKCINSLALELLIYDRASSSAILLSKAFWRKEESRDEGDDFLQLIGISEPESFRKDCSVEKNDFHSEMKENWPLIKSLTDTTFKSMGEVTEGLKK